MILKIIAVAILIICLFLIAEITKSFQKRKEKSIKGFLFLHADNFLKGLRIVFFGITILVFKEYLLVVEKVIGINLYLGDFLGIAGAVTLSYGLFLIFSPFKKSLEKEET